MSAAATGRFSAKLDRRIPYGEWPQSALLLSLNGFASAPKFQMGRPAPSDCSGSSSFCRSWYLLWVTAQCIRVRQVTCSICQPFASSAWQTLSATRDSLTAKQRKRVGRDIAT